MCRCTKLQCTTGAPKFGAPSSSSPKTPRWQAADAGSPRQRTSVQARRQRGAAMAAPKAYLLRGDKRLQQRGGADGGSRLGQLTVRFGGRWRPNLLHGSRSGQQATTGDEEGRFKVRLGAAMAAPKTHLQRRKGGDPRQPWPDPVAAGRCR
ncbi:hypothetical protein ACLOJK_022391 [Asimina triloba]